MGRSAIVEVDEIDQHSGVIVQGRRRIGASLSNMIAHQPVRWLWLGALDSETER